MLCCKKGKRNILSSLDEREVRLPRFSAILSSSTQHRESLSTFFVHCVVLFICYRHLLFIILNYNNRALENRYMATLIRIRACVSELTLLFSSRAISDGH